MRSLRDRHRKGQHLFRLMGATAPAMGMVGTLIGLVQMLQTMEDPASIGPSMAVALLTTLYGAVFAFLVFIPLADKLENRTKDEVRNMEVIIDGIARLQSLENPRLIRERLESFLDPPHRSPQEEKAAA
jgi:chemotaxis protein MotA